MRRVSDERGFVLTELLLVMVIGTLLLGATLVTFERFVRNSNENDVRNDTIEMARNGLDLQAKQLRNLARRTDDDPVIMTPLAADELVFQTSDPTRTWVRYCMDTTDPTNGKVLQQNRAVPLGTTSSPVTAGMRSGCPASGWSQTRLVATNVVNRIDGLDRPMFSYQCAGGGSACLDPANADQIVGISSTLYVDTKPVNGPGVERVSSGVYLRNQNQAPVARFTATPVSGASRTVLLNASGSSDYEQRTLSYFWFEGAMPTDIDCKEPGTSTTPPPWGGNFISRSLTVQHTFGGTAGTQTIGLVVCDPGFRPSVLVTQTVAIPA